MQSENQKLDLIIALINKDIRGEINSAESSVLQRWMDQNEVNKILVQQLSDKSYRQQELNILTDFTNDNTAFERFMHKVGGKAPVIVRFSMWRRMSIAAAALIGILGAELIYHYAYKDPLSSSLAVTDITPAKQGATLKLANGKIIHLSSAKNELVTSDHSMAYEDGSVVSKFADDNKQTYSDAEKDIDPTRNVLTVSTNKGNVYMIVLPDGSKAWLNATSSLTFPSTFKNSAYRIVQTSGEVYFEIAKDKAHPFRVQTSKQTVEVLGTHFNINAYQGAEIKTTLLEGSVKVGSVGSKSIMLKPGQQSVFTAGTITQKNIDPRNVIAWKDGYFSFRGQSLPEIMDILSRWYDVEVTYHGNITKDLFNGKISRLKNLTQVLKMLEATGLVHFEVTGRRVVVKE